jgi:hypothetical protein
MKWLQTTRKKLRAEESLLSVVREFYFNVRIIAQHMVRPISKLSMDHEGILKQRVQKRTSSVCVSLTVLTYTSGPSLTIRRGNYPNEKKKNYGVLKHHLQENAECLGQFYLHNLFKLPGHCSQVKLDWSSGMLY